MAKPEYDVNADSLKDSEPIGTLIIGGYPVPVYRYTEAASEEELGPLNGCFSTEPAEIHVKENPSISEWQKTEALLHEVLHAISFFTMEYDGGKGGLSERQVTMLSRVLLDTITRNEWFKKRLTGES